LVTPLLSFSLLFPYSHQFFLTTTFCSDASQEINKPLRGDAICDCNAYCETMKTNVASVVYNCFFYKLGLVADVVWMR
jgi:hypothetical protein